MGMLVPFTSKQLLMIIRAARRDFDSHIRQVKYEIRVLNDTGYAGCHVLIAEDLAELARLRKLIVHCKQQLKEAQIRDIQDLL